MDDVREALAALEHEQWAHWTRYLIEGGYMVPGDHLERWRRQSATPYAALSEAEKDSDRAWADRALALFRQWHAG